MTLETGTHLGPYEIVAPLGAGGMGEVYRARDTRLQRDVAVKVVPEHLAKDGEALHRFEREAHAVAALSHPNIVAIHDVGTEQGVSFVVMELLEGETLRARVRRSAVPWREAIKYGVAIADGLAAAHAKGIIHRDLKPENIFLTQDGVVKIIDFGLARIVPAVGQSRPPVEADTPTVTLDTRPGTVIGTVNYMSPEQVRGHPTSTRSDIFSFGCVLYEMVTGRRAFSGETAADTITGILKEEPPDIADSGLSVPPELEQAIRHCLEKKPEARFQSARDLAFSLNTILSSSKVSVPSWALERPRRSRASWILAACLSAVALSALLVALNVGGWRARPFAAVTPGSIQSLAVLPLANLSGDPEQDYFADGMTDALITNLSKIGALKVISRTSAMRYKGTDKSLPEIARELNVDAVVEGSVLRVGNRVRITAQLIEAATDRHLWAKSYERELHDLLTLQSEVARTIAEAIKVKLTPAEHELLASAPQVNPEAYDAYVRGKEMLRRGTRRSCQTALTFFDQALGLDPEFAMAHAGRANAYYVLGSTHMHPADTLPGMKQAAEAALALDENLPEAHIVLGYYLLQSEWAWERAGESFKRALELNPNLAQARLAYADYLVAMKRTEEGMAQLDMVLELNPAARYTEPRYGGVSFVARRFERTIRDGREALKVDPEFWPAHQWMGLAQGELKQFADAIDHLRTAVDLSQSPTVRAMLGAVLALAGESKEARAIREDLRNLPDALYVCPYEVATISIGLNEYDEAFDDMYQACDDRAECIPWLQVDPRLDPIRDDPRFDALLRRVGFQPRTPVLTLAEPPREKVRLAVLPFEDMSPEPQEWFSDGMTEEMIARLGRLQPKKLGVIARTSVMRYKNTTKGIDRIGRELTVEYILEGSVLRIGERVRITVQLVQVSDQTHLWAETYDRTTQDVFAIQSDVARRVAGALAVTLLPEDQSTLDREPTASSVAHDAYLKGLYHWNKRTESSLQRAIQFFESAVETDPDFALAHVGLALTHVVLASHGYLAPTVALIRVKEEAEKAIALDETLGEAHLALAVYRSYKWDHRAAESELREAIRLNPAHPTSHQWYAEFLTGQGRFEEALLQIEQAQHLDPASRIINAAVGMIYYRAHRFDEAVEQTLRALAFDPNFPFAHFVLGRCYAEMGLFEDAVAAINKAIALGERSIEYVAALGYAHARAGRVDEAKRVLDELNQRSRTQYVSAYNIARVYAGLGEVDEAFRRLDRAYEERAFEIGWILRADPSFKSLHGDPRFDDLLRRIGQEPSSEPDRHEP